MSTDKNHDNELTAEQLAHIERNRQKALLRQQKKQRDLTTDEVYRLERYNELNVQSSQDFGGGFFVDHHDSDRKINSINNSSLTASSTKITIKPDTRENVCDECDDNFSNSYLLSNFGEKICDSCKDLKQKHKLITRTEAKQEYLLTDVDLDKRDPPLRCIMKRNPRVYARGHMRLYLRLQVEERALEVWGSEQQLEEERENRDAKREGRKRKQFDKQMKELRMQARSSLYHKRLQSQSHEHDFGDEQLIEPPPPTTTTAADSDGEYYQQTCKTCGLKKVFEKL
ncbi:hypothetical protein DERF_009703 [Dermatophagoides farinae]|uniref:XPA C-terminal domain-containing protein n=1 Tax=Dermatophagoides farinae TaxID=6954 RepID=A0A922HZQ0_DERFA|nr:hypothetical protein DERF_009703 [Dermatophagoides farinae]